MSRNPERDAIQTAATRKALLEAGFRIFSERTIDKVTMAEVASAAGFGVATVYRYFPTKPMLVSAISAWVWEEHMKRTDQRLDQATVTAAVEFEFYLENFVDLYRNHRDLLRFNQFFNVYVENEGVEPELLRPFTDVVRALAVRFHGLYAKAEEDGTLRTDVPENVIFSATLHLMLAAVTRYAVGLVYDGGVDPEQELVLLKDMLLRQYVRN